MYVTPPPPLALVGLIEYCAVRVIQMILHVHELSRHRVNAWAPLNADEKLDELAKNVAMISEAEVSEKLKDHLITTLSFNSQTSSRGIESSVASFVTHKGLSPPIPRLQGGSRRLHTDDNAAQSVESRWADNRRASRNLVVHHLGRRESTTAGLDTREGGILTSGGVPNYLLLREREGGSIDYSLHCSRCVLRSMRVICWVVYIIYYMDKSR